MLSIGKAYWLEEKHINYRKSILTREEVYWIKRWSILKKKVKHIEEKGEAYWRKKEKEMKDHEEIEEPAGGSPWMN